MAGLGAGLSLGILIFSFACVATLILRMWQRKLDALFLVGYFAILLVWPFPAERIRFVLPAIPFFVVQMLLALHEFKLGDGGRHSSTAMRVALVVLAITVMPSFVLAAQRQFEPMPQEMEGHRQSPEWHGVGSREARLVAVFQYRRLHASFEQLRLLVPITDCVYSIKPSLVGLFAQRVSYRFPLPNTTLGKNLDAKAAQCRYVHMVAFSSPTYSEPFYPLSRWHDHIDILNATHFIDGDESSTVLGLLGKLK